MTFPTWPNVNYVVVSDEDYLLATEAQKVIDAALLHGGHAGYVRVNKQQAEST